MMEKIAVQTTSLTWLSAAETLSFAEITDTLKPHLPLLSKLPETPQEAEWHAEGNVAAHSALVYGHAATLADAAELSGDDRSALLISAALHDIGKALTTCEEPDEQGVMRLRSRQHARRGRDYLAYRLLDAGFAPDFLLTVLNLVAHHHSLHRALDDDLGRGVYALGRRVPLPLLVLLARADARGREVRSGDTGRGEDQADLLELTAQELGIFALYQGETCKAATQRGAAKQRSEGYFDPYAEFRHDIQTLLPDAPPDLLALAIGRGIQDWEAGIIHTPHEAVARVQDAAKQGFPRLTVMCGPSGSGKSTLAAAFAGAEIISLDALRAKLGKNSSDQSVNGQVLQAARESLRAGLRQKKHVIWDATSLRRDQRRQVLGLGRDYGALTEIRLLWTSPNGLVKRNSERVRVVSPAVICDQLNMLEFPEVGEAHKVGYRSEP